MGAAHFESGTISLPSKPASTVKPPSNSATKTLFIDSDGVLSTKDFSGKVSPIAAKQVQKAANPDEQIVLFTIPKLTKLEVKHENLLDSVGQLINLANDNVNKLNDYELAIGQARNDLVSQQLALDQSKQTIDQLASLVDTINTKRIEQDMSIDNVNNVLMKTTSDVTRFKNQVLEATNATGQAVLNLNKQIQTWDAGELV